MTKVPPKERRADDAMPYSHCIVTPVPFQSDEGSNATTVSAQLSDDEIGRAIESIMSAVLHEGGMS